MIEFKRHGPFEKENDEHEDTTPVKIIGIGAAGINVVDQIVLDQHGLTNLLCIDTDRQALAASVVEAKILIGERALLGLGTGGDPTLAQSIIAKEDGKDKIRAAVEKTQMAIIVTGLGGGTGGGIVENVIDVLKECGTSVIVLGIAPLACEGARRATQSKKIAAILRKKADALMLFSNDRLLQIPDVKENVRGGFRALNIILGQTCKTISHLLTKHGLVQINLSDFQELMGECAGLSGELENCWVGMGMGSGPDRAREAIEQTLFSPLFSDGVTWDTGDNALVCVEGGEDFSISEFHELVEKLKAELPANFKLKAGAIVNPNLDDAVTITLFVARAGEDEVVTTEIPQEQPVEQPHEFVLSESEEKMISSGNFSEVRKRFDDDESLVKRSQHQPKPQKYFAEQGELALETPIFQGRFEKAAPTIFNGQNLNQPTFLRLGIKIRL